VCFKLFLILGWLYNDFRVNNCLCMDGVKIIDFGTVSSVRLLHVRVNCIKS
jgi:hypothetical protein